MESKKLRLSRSSYVLNDVKLTPFGAGEFEAAIGSSVSLTSESSEDSPTTSSVEMMSLPRDAANGSSAAQDTFVLSTQPDTVQAYAAGTFQVAKGGSVSGTAYAYVFYPSESLPQISSSFSITSAVLRLTLQTNFTLRQHRTKRHRVA